MFKGEPAIRYSHSAQTIKAAEVTMENLLSLGVWTQWAHGELKWRCVFLAWYCFLSVLCLYHSQLGSTLSLWLPKMHWVCHGFPSNAVALFVGASKSRNSPDGNYVPCTPAFFFTMPVESSLSPLFPVELGCCCAVFINRISCTKSKHWLILMNRTDQ